MPGGWRLGLLAWGNRRALARVMVGAVAAVLALPVVLAVAVLASVPG